MFTGLVEAIGTIERVADTSAGLEFRVSCPWSDLVAGASVAMNGACLTVRESGDGWFLVAAVATTLGRTCMESWTTGTLVNLERAMRLGDRLGGHLVQGHVDDVGTVRSVARQGSALLIDVEVPAEVARLLVPHGSVTVDGVSLTVNAIPEPGILQVSIIAHTEAVTTLGRLAAGDRVHLEADVIARYVQALLAPYQGPPGSS
jgi:riboflavin synthase